jgi:hypothetical protein
MTPELKARWIKALTSGEYDQTSTYLKRGLRSGVYPAGYCCLGVLLEIEGNDFDKDEHYFKDDYTMKMLTGEFMNKVGITAAAADEFAEMNDSGRSFDDIAEQIEEHL